MAIQVEHEIHRRRRGRNLGLLAVLVGFVAVMFGLTVVKVLSLDDIRAMESFDHVGQDPTVAVPEESVPEEGAP